MKARLPSLHPFWFRNPGASQPVAPVWPETETCAVGLGSCLVPTRRILAVQASEAMHADG